jgi:DNA-binding response OmpR family regulator
MTSPRPVALIAEDEPQMTMIVEYILGRRGFDSIVARTGAEALDMFHKHEPDVVLLDITMPRMSGLEVCKEIRRLSQVPILMVTAHGEAEDILAGFRAGADDYVTKPFDPRVLGTRVDNAMRRGAILPVVRINLDDLSIDLQERSVEVLGTPVSLSIVEWRVLIPLAERVDDVVSWRALLRRAWETEDWLGGRELVKSTVYRLRHKLGPAGAKHIETVRGEGYRLRSNTAERYRQPSS